MLEGLREKFNMLVSLYEAEKHRADELEARLAESAAELESRKERINELNHQLDNLKLSTAFTAVADGESGAKERIDKLIREIDKCIALFED